MPLDYLPEEVLCIILSDIDLHKKDLLAVARASHLFYHLTLSYLYKYIKINLDHDYVVDKLSHTLAERPSLGQLVRELSLYSSDCFGRPDTLKQITYDRACRLLAKLPALQTLTLGQHVHLPKSPTSLFAWTSSSLQHVTFLSHETTIPSIAAGMLLPNITKVSANLLDDYFDGDYPSSSCSSFDNRNRLERLVPMLGPHTSSLKILHLDGELPPGAAVAPLLLYPKALESFTVCYSSNNPMCPLDFWSAAILWEMLMPVRLTLTQLHIDERNIIWEMKFGEPPIDFSGEPPIDFSGFKSLKDLNISNRFLLLQGEDDTASAKRGLYKRLPKSLQTLQIIFVDEAYVLNKPGEIRQAQDHAWISELIWYKDQYLPNLQLLSFEESNWVPATPQEIERGDVIYPEEWDYPNDIVQILETAEVELEVFLGC